MSEVKVNKISPRTNCGTVQLGDSGDTITIPAGATITNNGTQTGFGRTGTVDWDTTTKTSTFTGVSGDGFFCDTSSSAFTCNLPSGTAGSIISLADYAGTFQTNNLTVSPNGTQKIGGTNADVILNTEGQSVTFVYVDDTQGWINVQDSTSNERGQAFIVATGGTITTCGNDKIHTFTGPGTFTVCTAAVCAANNVVSYLVVAGGGGSSNDGGGGGGAGGFREVKSPVTPYTASPLDGYPSAPNRITVSAQGYPITVGAGGTASGTSAGGTGNPAVFSTITSAGGGGGGGPGSINGVDGGSGGGGRSNSSANGGSGNTPPVTPSQGNNGGGTNGSNPQPNNVGGGGGGATAAGQVGGGPETGDGGAGATTNINGSPTAFAGGGGGGGNGSPGAPSGGAGGGGNGAAPGGGGTAGTANTGGGAGGSAGPGGPPVGVAGGSGIVIIRYKFQ
jgi:hypothetical protein